ncbi:unnamed protein product [Lampetra planeri]
MTSAWGQVLPFRALRRQLPPPATSRPTASTWEPANNDARVADEIPPFCSCARWVAVTARVRRVVPSSSWSLRWPEALLRRAPEGACLRLSS